MSHIVQDKIERIQAGGAPRVVDLFCGAGGFSLGFERAGCEILGGVELDPKAIATHAAMFHGSLRETAPALYEAHATPRDIRETDPLTWLGELGVADPASAVDVIIGGPPCPAFTRVGRAKLREIHAHPEAYRHDPRATLYLPYLDWVRQLQPVALVMENVPEVLNFAGHNLGEEFCEVLEGLGYRCVYSVVNAAAYGVPQMRSRFVLVGVHERAGVAPTLPAPTHRVDLPSGYRQLLLVALRPLRDAGIPGRYIELPAAGANQPPAVPAGVAMAGLPPLTGHLQPGRKRRAQQHLDERGARPYPAPDPGAVPPWVEEHMLGWPGRAVSPGADPVCAHVTRALTWRDFRLFRALEPGQDYFAAYDLALDLFESRWTALAARCGVAPAELDAPGAATARLEGLEQRISSLRDGAGPVRPSELHSEWTALRGELAAAHANVCRVAAEAEALARAHGEAATVVVEDPMPLWTAANAVLGALSMGTREVRSLGRRDDRATAQLLRTLRRHARRDAAWAAGLRYRRGAVAPSAEVAAGRLALVETLPSAEHFAAVFDAVRAAVEDRNLLFWNPDDARTALLDLLLAHVIRMGQVLSIQTLLKGGFVPPYVPDKFPNKWRKMEPDAPARTLMAHLGKDTYSHIHPDSAQARTITVREAARLQSFPDGFQFSGAMNAAFKQVGNAVPPLMAWRVGEAVCNLMKGPETRLV